MSPTPRRSLIDSEHVLLLKALVLLAPFLVNALAFHLCLEPSGLPNTLVFVAMELYLAWTYRAAYRPLGIARTPLP